MGKYQMMFDFCKFAQNAAGKMLALTRLPKTIRDKKYMKQNEAAKELKTCDTCYVIGLGPSLKDVDLSALDGDTIVVNRYYLFDTERVLQPTFYCLMDGAIFGGFATDIFHETTKLYPNTGFIVNGKYRKEIQGLLQNDAKMFYTYQWNGLFSAKKKVDFTKVTPAFGNVVCGAIGFAMWCGYKRIILLGCDFNSFASQKSTHCYREDNNQRQISMAFELFNYSFEADTHLQLAEYARKHGIQIVNQTEGSLIDAYEFEDCCKKKRP